MSRDAVQAYDAGLDPESFTIDTGVVLSDSRDLVFVMRPGGGIEALETDTGQTRWTHTEATQPLFVTGSTLWSLVETGSSHLRLVPLAAKTGAVDVDTHGTVNLVLPDGVMVAMDKTLLREFTIAAVTVDGEPRLNWRYIARDPSGVPPPHGRTLAQFESGQVRFTGSGFESVSSAAQARPPGHLPASVQTELKGLPSTQPPWLSTRVIATTEQGFAPPRLTLRRWRIDTGEALMPVELLQGRAVAVLPSCDGTAVMVAESNRHTTPREPYRLHLFDTDSGAEIAKLPSQQSASPFCLAAGHLLRVSPPQRRRDGDKMESHPLELVSVDLQSNRVRWRKAYRDIRFQGPAIPRVAP